MAKLVSFNLQDSAKNYDNLVSEVVSNPVGIMKELKEVHELLPYVSVYSEQFDIVFGGSKKVFQKERTTGMWEMLDNFQLNSDFFVWTSVI